jgi:hypothetical protein
MLTMAPLRGDDGDLGVSTINARNVDGGPPGGNDEDLGAPTINERNIDRGG